MRRHTVVGCCEESESSEQQSEQREGTQVVGCCEESEHGGLVRVKQRIHVSSMACSQLGTAEALGGLGKHDCEDPAKEG